MKKWFSTAIVFSLGVFLLAASASCRRVPSNAKRYELKGKVVAIEPDKHLVTVAHEDIKNYMPGMTMPFTVPDDSAFAILRPGDQINAMLVVDGARSWLEELVISQESAEVNPAKSDVPPEAKPGDDVPDYGLLNQDGKPIKIHSYRGKTLLLTFIYTRCPMPDQCNLMSENFSNIDHELQKQPDLYAKTHLLSVSFDPEYDTPGVLRSYGAAQSGRYSDENFQHWEFASGTKDQVKGIAQFFGLRYYEGNGQIIHALRTIVITPESKVYKVYRGNDWKPEQLLADIKAAKQ